VIATKLTSLKQYQTRLLKELRGSSQHVLELVEKLDSLPLESEVRADIEGELYARALQLELDAADVRKVMDEITAALPEDET